MIYQPVWVACPHKLCLSQPGSAKKHTRRLYFFIIQTHTGGNSHQTAITKDEQHGGGGYGLQHVYNKLLHTRVNWIKAFMVHFSDQNPAMETEIFEVSFIHILFF